MEDVDPRRLGLDTNPNPEEPLRTGCPGTVGTKVMFSSRSSIRSSVSPSFRFMVPARSAKRGSSAGADFPFAVALPGDSVLPGLE